MYAYIKEADFPAALQNKILPYLHARRVEQTVTGKDCTKLYTACYKANAPRGTLLITHGFSENADKYREFIYECLLRQISVLIYDHRGHGRSTRKAPLGVIHVDRFSHYIEDFDAVFAAWEEALTPPFYLFGHSMGGAIAALLLEKYPARFARAVLSAPMLNLTYQGKDRLSALLAANLACIFTNRKKAIPVKKKEETGSAFERSNYRSRARFDAVRALSEENPLLGGGTPSRSWAREALRVPRKIFQKGAPESIVTPTLLFTAELENLVSNQAHAIFAARAPHVTHVTLPAVRHEILFAEDERTFPVLDRIFDFLQ